jgi:hypothetical protein
MKTFEEFITEEPVIKQLVKHYINTYKRITSPHPAKVRRMKNQDLIDKYKLHYGISQDLSIPVGKRRKAADKAQQHLDDLKQELK